MILRPSLFHLFAIAACLATPPNAQTLRGRVVDATTGRPLAHVLLEVLRADNSAAMKHVTDTSGRFVFSLESGGVYRLRTSHVSYQPSMTREISLGEQEEITADIRLGVLPIELDPLEVVVRRRDARHDATAEGMYARHRHFPPIGNRRVFLPHDPEMVNAIGIGDILRWSPPARGCRIVYWNGLLQGSAEAASMRMDMPVSLLEGVEYYRSISDAPLAYRDIPAYLAACMSFHVVALWPRIGQ